MPRRAPARCRPSAAWAYSTPRKIDDVAEFVLSLSGRADDKAAAERGAKIFADNCSPCHGKDGKGNQTLGAPDLTDQLWLYGGDKPTIAETVINATQRRDAGLGRAASIRRRSRSLPSMCIRWAAVSNRGC